MIRRACERATRSVCSRQENRAPDFIRVRVGSRRVAVFPCLRRCRRRQIAEGGPVPPLPPSPPRDIFDSPPL